MALCPSRRLARSCTFQAVAAHPASSRHASSPPRSCRSILGLCQMQVAWSPCFSPRLILGNLLLDLSASRFNYQACHHFTCRSYSNVYLSASCAQGLAVRGHACLLHVLHKLTARIGHLLEEIRQRAYHLAHSIHRHLQAQAFHLAHLAH